MEEEQKKKDEEKKKKSKKIQVMATVGNNDKFSSLNEQDPHSIHAGLVLIFTYIQRRLVIGKTIHVPLC